MTDEPNGTENQSQHSQKGRKKYFPVLAFAVSLLAVVVALWQGYNAQKSYEVGLRAYLGVVSDGAPILNADPSRIPLKIVNYGNTPAYRIYYAVRGFQEDPKVHADKYRWTFTILPPILGYLTREFGKEFPADYRIAREAVEDGSRLRLYVEGIVIYSDIYGDRYFTQFCLRYTSKSLDGLEPAEYCEKDNEAGRLDEIPSSLTIVTPAGIELGR